MREQHSARIGRVAPAFADAGGEGHHRGAERIRKDHGAAEASRLQHADAFARIAVPRNDAAEDAGRGQERGDVLRRGHGDAAFAAEAVRERAIGGKREDVVPDPIEADYDRLTGHLMFHFRSHPARSPSSGRASTTITPGELRYGEKSRH